MHGVTMKIGNPLGLFVSSRWDLQVLPKCR